MSVMKHVARPCRPALRRRAGPNSALPAPLAVAPRGIARDGEAVALSVGRSSSLAKIGPLRLS